MTLTTPQKEEVRAEIAIHPELSTAAPRIIAQVLNTAGTAQTETWVVSDKPREVFKAQFGLVLSDTGCASIQALLEGSDAASLAFRFRWNSVRESLDLADTKVRDMIASFCSAGLISTDERNALLRMGEERASRAYEIIGRAITADEVQEALNG